MSKLTKSRIAIITVILALLILCIIVYVANPIENDIFPCTIKKTTGLSCPSCGGTRWAYCMMKFDFKKAFYYHAYLTVMFLPIMYILTAVAVNGFFDKKLIPYPKHPLAEYIICLALLVVFTVVRNFIPTIL